MSAKIFVVISIWKEVSLSSFLFKLIRQTKQTLSHIWYLIFGCLSTTYLMKRTYIFELMLHKFCYFRKNSDFLKNETKFQLPTLEFQEKEKENSILLECCFFVFLDGPAYYFDEFMRKVTGFYRVMYGSVNGHPHYVARNCRKPDEYGSSCTYIWYSG